MAKAAAAAV